MCLNETYNKTEICIHLKQGDAFQLCFKPQHYEGPRVKECMKPNRIHQLLVYGDCIHLFG